MLLVPILFTGCATSTATTPVNPGDRPYQLATNLVEGALKDKLLSCASGLFEKSDFSISHRGAPLGYPEHTREGYEAAVQMGAGALECDVTFTKDLALVCRHSQCDLHTTTNILTTPLAAQCSEGFTPASGETPASAKCCTSDITLSQFKTLCGRHDYVDRTASTVEDYLARKPTLVDTPEIACGTLMTHDESVALFDEMGVDFIPELKAPLVPMPFAGMSQTDYANRMLEAYANVDADRVHPQSFNLEDVKHWIAEHPEFAERAVFLDGRARNPDFKATEENMRALYETGVRVLAPPMPLLLIKDDNGELEPSPYAVYAKAAGFQLVTWTFEAGLATDPRNFMYINLPGYMTSEAQMLQVLDALAQKVGVRGIFSDWPGTVTYYANCMNLD